MGYRLFYDVPKVVFTVQSKKPKADVAPKEFVRNALQEVQEEIMKQSVCSGGEKELFDDQAAPSIKQRRTFQRKIYVSCNEGGRNIQEFPNLRCAMIYFTGKYCTYVTDVKSFILNNLLPDRKAPRHIWRYVAATGDKVEI